MRVPPRAASGLRAGDAHDLRVALSLNEAALESTADGLLVVGIDGRITRYNRRFATMWRLPSDLLDLGDDARAIASVLDQLKDPSSFQRKVEELYNDPEAESFDTLEFKDGRVFERYSKPQRLGDVVVGRVWSFRDVTAQKEAERALRASEEKYRSLYTHTPAILHSIDREGRIISVSRTWLDTMGYSEEEVLGHRSTEFLAPASRRYAEEVVLPAYFRTGECKDVPYQFVKKDGEIIDVLLSATAERDDHGQIVRSLAVLADVTQSNLIARQLEQERRATLEKEAQYRRIIETTQEGVWSIDAEGRTNYVNPRLTEMLGYSAEEMVGRSLFDFIDEDAKPEAEQRLARRRQGDRETHEFRLRRKDGTPLWTLISASPIQDENGAFQGAVAMITDITLRKAAEDGLRGLQAEQRIILDSVPAMIWYKDTNNRLLRANRRAAESQGTTVQEMEGRRAEDYWPEEAAQYLADDLEVARTGEPKLGIVERYRTPSGEKIWVRTDKVPYRDDHGQVIGVIVFSVDISHAMRTEEELARYREHLEELVAQRTLELRLANDELEAFGYRVSHDLRAPLRGIQAYCRALLEDQESTLPPEALGHVERVRANALRMGHLIDDILRLSRAASAQLRPEPVDLSAIAREICADLADQEPHRNADVIIQDGLRTEGDPALLRAALENLLANAWKYTSKQPRARIEVGSVSYAGEITFYVRDNGVGFDMKEADRLFTAFHRLGTAAPFEGTGVGLATVKRILQRHGGRIWAVGAVGQGATFSFTIPPPAGSSAELGDGALIRSR